MKIFMFLQYFLAILTLGFLSLAVISQIIFSFWVYRTTKDKNLVWILWFVDLRLMRYGEYSERHSLKRLTHSQINFYRFINKLRTSGLRTLVITLLFYIFNLFVRS